MQENEFVPQSSSDQLERSVKSGYQVLTIMTCCPLLIFSSVQVEEENESVPTTEVGDSLESGELDIR